MLTAQVVLIIAAVVFIAVAITGSGLFVKVKLLDTAFTALWSQGEDEITVKDEAVDRQAQTAVMLASELIGVHDYAP